MTASLVALFALRSVVRSRLELQRRSSPCSSNSPSCSDRHRGTHGCTQPTVSSGSLKGAKTGSRGGLGVLVNDAAEAIATFDAESAIGSERPRALSIRRGEPQGPGEADVRCSAP
jgi:hypothetical protein